MAFDQKSFTTVGGQSGRRDVFQMFNYKTQDSVETISATGYFNSISTLIDKGDIIRIIVTDSSGNYVSNSGLIITDNAFGSVTVQPTSNFTEQQYFGAKTLIDGANVSWDLNNNQVAKLTLAGNRTLDNPTNMKDGATYILIISQDATGSRTLSYGSAYKWPGGTAPTLTTTANAIDVLSFVSDGTNMFGVSQLDFQ